MRRLLALAVTMVSGASAAAPAELAVTTMVPGLSYSHVSVEAGPIDTVYVFDSTEVQLVDLRRRQLLRRWSIAGHTGALAFSADGKWFAVVFDGEVRVFASAGGSPVVAKAVNVRAASLSADAARLRLGVASGPGAAEVIELSVPALRELSRVKLDVDARGVQLLPDGSLQLARATTVVMLPDGGIDPVTRSEGERISRNGRHLLDDRGQKLTVRDRSTGAVQWSAALAEGPSSLSTAADLIADQHGDGTVTVRSLSTGDVVRRVRCPWFTDARLTAEGRWWVGRENLTELGSCELRDEPDAGVVTPTSALVCSMTGDSVAVSGDCRRKAALRSDDELPGTPVIEVLDAKSGAAVARLLPDLPPERVQFSVDGSQVLTVATITQRDTDRELPEHTVQVFSVATPSLSSRLWLDALVELAFVPVGLAVLTKTELAVYRGTPLQKVARRSVRNVTSLSAAGALPTSLEPETGFFAGPVTDLEWRDGELLVRRVDPVRLSAVGALSRKGWFPFPGAEATERVGVSAREGCLAVWERSAPVKTAEVRWRQVACVPSDASVEGPVAVSADGRRAIAVTGRSSLTVWNLTARAALRTIEQPHRVVRLALSADGTLAYAALEMGTVVAYDTATGLERFRIESPRAVVALAATAKGFAVAFADGAVEVYAGQTLRFRHQCSSLEGPLALRFTPRGDRLFIGTEQGTVLAAPVRW